MNFQIAVSLSLLLCAAVIGYIAWQYKLSKGSLLFGRPTRVSPARLQIAASVQPSPGVKVHLLRWRSEDDAQQGEFLLLTTAQTAQLTPCKSLTFSETHASIHSNTSVAHV